MEEIAMGNNEEADAASGHDIADGRIRWFAVRGNYRPGLFPIYDDAVRVVAWRPCDDPQNWEALFVDGKYAGSRRWTYP
ncbi:hypothetical protein BE21_58405 [Sorangium cellulosum]|uniref:Uncharacterized protein n=1 Tax=Sorangium cellulosum TaxID=56 RepID=A0A150U214_SORCE|nr:hypothetical protein BE21_58405 [Sorangium cellulosum]